MKSLSLYNKILFIFLSTIILSLVAVGWYGMKSTSEAYIKSAYDLSKQSTASLALEIESSLEHVSKDLLYMSDFYALNRFLIWNAMAEDKKANKWKQIFSDALVDSLDTQEIYYKAGVIDLQGNEVINAKYDRAIDSTKLTAKLELQNKAGREYVEKPKTMQKGMFYVSELNLNKEHGKVMKPFLPVLRYSTPIINKNGELVAILTMSVYADKILKMIEKQVQVNKKKGVSFYLVDKSGNYLYNENEEKRWNAQLKNGFTFTKEHFDIQSEFKDKKSGILSKNGKIYSFYKVHPLTDNQENYWYVISSVKESIALASLEEFKIMFVFLLLFVVLASFFIVRSLVLKITTPLSKVTKQLKALSAGEIQKEEIVYHSNDEVGNIVKSTAILVDAIETTIQQARAVADGDFSKDIELLGKNDSLGLAIIDMKGRLKEITALSTSLSSGNYEVNIIARSSEDKLGLALIEMIEYLKGITSITESIAVGELDVKYKAKGNKDRLGRAILQMIKYLRTILKQANAISKENFDSTITVKSKDDELGLALVTMTDMLRDSSVKNKNEIFFSEGIGDFGDKITGVDDKNELAKIAITTICRYLKASSGVIYTPETEKKELHLIASFAYVSRDNLSNSFKLGEGIVGQVGLEKEPILLKNIKDTYIDVQSGTTVGKPKEIYAFPLIHEKELFGVAEIMSFESFSEIDRDYLAKVASLFATALFSATQNTQIKELLEKSQQAFEELQTQSEELQETNVQMEEQQQQLTEQSKELRDKNDGLLKAKEEIDQRAEDLEKASKYKSEFLANMSHELRTPLNSIILLSKLLSQNQEENLSQSDIDKSDVIHKAGHDLLLLINDILDLSKIESGNMELVLENIYSGDILEELKGLFSPVAEDKKIEFIINDNFDSEFMLDEVKLSQVLKNLLSNAFKFTKEGSVILDVDANANEIIFKVTDTGIGIPAGKLDVIFDAFKQVDGSISREFGGTGLGLSISKTMVDLFGGRIEIESEFSKGTSFIVTLPLKYDKKQVTQVNQTITKSQTEVFPHVEIQDNVMQSTSIIIEDKETSFDEKGLSGKNILIVDDDSRNIFTLTSILESMDAEVYSAFNGKEAIGTLEEGTKIDLILMDVMMPIMDGLEAIKSIKSNDKFKHIPIIAVTAKVMPEDKQTCLDAGANDYLPKPLEPNALVSMLKAWVK